AQHEGGLFRFDGLDDGVYVVRVAADGFIAAKSEPVSLSLDAPLPPPLTLRLARGLRLAGRGIDAQRAGVPGVELALRTAGAAGRGPASGIVVARLRSAADGGFAFDGLAPGRYVLTGEHESFERALAELDLSSDRTDFELTLQPAASLFGRVLGLGPGDAAQVVAFRGFGRLSLAPVAEDGSYRFAALSPGPYAVRAFVGEPSRFFAEEDELFDSPGGASLAADLTLRPGASLRHDLMLTRHPRGSLSGRVTENGAPLAA